MEIEPGRRPLVARQVAAARGALVGGAGRLADGRAVKVVSVYVVGGWDTANPGAILVQWWAPGAPEGMGSRWGFVRLDRWPAPAGCSQ